MKKYLYAGILLASNVLTGCSGEEETNGQVTGMLGNKDISENKAEEITEVEISDESLDNWNKINMTLKEKSPNNYYFENMDLHNGDILLLHGESQGLKLKSGDNVLVDLTMIPDGLSHTGVGYILDGKYTEVFFEPVSDKLTTSFDVKVAGDYIICIIGGNANFITITDGAISID
ncbi:hypothetical protein [Psychrobacillus sp. NPDC096389]|uniref:hypothetical protein n=1 Tax=Psychrobacillus sp. NPDC096389 TaxID=3364490 RepID=UPI00381BD06A